MTNRQHEHSRPTNRRYGVAVVMAVIVGIGIWGMWNVQARAQNGKGAKKVPVFKVDPFWPKPLPAPKDASGIPHQWVTGEVGGTCVDSRDHIITVNRGFQKNGLTAQDGTMSVPAPPVIEYDSEGNIVNSWGDATIAPNGANAVMPNGMHGCFVDYQDNIWIGGNGDGVVQKWTHDGKKMLLQIGTKGTCDGPPTLSPNAPYPTCGSPGANTSHTLQNQPPDIAVDPNPDPVTGEVGSVYIADGYGNHRIVVFDSKGKYLRQFGSAGSGPGQFVEAGGGHPHCVGLGKDGLIYTCDRGQNRILVFDRKGDLKRTIAIDPPTQPKATNRATDIAFSTDPDQTFMYVTDLGSDTAWIIDRVQGKIVGSIGHAGHNAGEFTFLHTLAMDSKGNLYVSETINGRRNQKFVPVNR